MIHWWSFLAGAVAVLLGSAVVLLGIVLWDTRRYPFVPRDRE